MSERDDGYIRSEVSPLEGRMYVDARDVDGYPLALLVHERRTADIRAVRARFKATVGGREDVLPGNKYAAAY